MTRVDVSGYDIIGDIHGCGDQLEALLDQLGYHRDGRVGPHRHPSRQALFVGDLIDRGPEQLQVLQTVEAMVECGSAQMVLGNHEFNAMAYATEWPNGSGKYLRPHDDPDNPKSQKNENQHREFLAQVTGDDRTHYLEWFKNQPLWLDLGELRVVHACWHDPSIAVVTRELGGDRFTSTDQLVRASTEDDELYAAVETLLKGPEISLTDHGHEPYFDKDGHRRDHARLRWWDLAARTLRALAELGGKFTTADGQPYPELPDTAVSGGHQDYMYAGPVPVFYGHYWRQGEPEHLHDWTEYTACVDFSAIKGGTLTAYRWSGESRINPEHYVSVNRPVGAKAQ